MLSVSKSYCTVSIKICTGPTNQWKCSNGLCIDMSLRCDLVKGCANSSDLLGCSKYSTAKNVLFRFVFDSVLNLVECTLLFSLSHVFIKYS
jgi:Low-density lipoprotein receptor domain class A